jgi:hypothetical protein
MRRVTRMTGVGGGSKVKKKFNMIKLKGPPFRGLKLIYFRKKNKFNVRKIVEHDFNIPFSMEGGEVDGRRGFRF